MPRLYDCCTQTALSDNNSVVEWPLAAETEVLTETTDTFRKASLRQQTLANVAARSTDSDCSCSYSEDVEVRRDRLPTV